MRHLWSLLAGVVAAPLAWLLIAAGQTQWQTTVTEWTIAGRFDTADLIAPAAFLAVAGILLGLLATLRVSPAGPLVAGLLLLVPIVGMLINPFDAADMISDDDGWRLLDQTIQPRLPVANGTLLILAALLLMAVFSGQRWRGWPAAAVAATAPVAVDQDLEPAPAAVDQDAVDQDAVAEPAPAPAAGDSTPDQTPADTEPDADEAMPRRYDDYVEPGTGDPDSIVADDAESSRTARHAAEAGSAAATEPGTQPDQPRQDSPWSAPPGSTNP